MTIRRDLCGRTDRRIGSGQRHERDGEGQEHLLRQEGDLDDDARQGRQEVEDLGVQLLMRDRRAVKLTELGKVFLVEARATLTRARQAEECLARAARGEGGRLKIGFVSSAALEIVPSVVSEFRKQHPEVTLDLINLRTVSQVKGLLGETVDIGFLRLPVSHDRLNIKIIHREKFAVILPKGHRLAKDKRLRIVQLQDEPFVVYGRRWAPGS